MKKSVIWSLIAAITFSFVLTSCDETEEVDVYANWQQRNDNYIESIKDKALANAGGNWRIIKDYNYPADSTTNFNGVTSQYIYVEVLRAGSGTTSPIFTDSVHVSYCGQLMPYTNADGEADTLTFQKTFYANPVDIFVKDKNSPVLKTLAPYLMSVGGAISGFSTALMHMHQGDVWKVYIPYQLGYGTSAQTSIPAYSTLVFYLYLQGIYPVGKTVPEWR